jgi:ketosteroid isomerase-like protein
MRKLNFAALLVIIAAAACYPPAAQESSELAAKADAWETALNAGDVDAIVALYTEDCRLMPPGAALVEGHAAVREIFGGMIDAGITGELETVEAMVAGDLGYRVGTYTLMTVEGMEVDRGKYIEVWRQVGGEWKITNDVWNSDLPGGSEGTTLSITHEVNDAARWLAAWQGADSRHEMFAQHGAPSVRVFQSVDNPNLTGLLIDVTDMDALQAFLDSPEGTRAKAEDGVMDPTMRVFMEVK